MRLRLLIFLMSGLAQLAHAEPITVRSGDHNAFTRLAFDIPQNVQWTVEQKAQIVTLRFAEHRDGFGLDTVFDRIDRRHIEAIKADENSVEISLACDCIAEAFRVSGRMMAIDVRDRRPEELVPVPSTVAETLAEKAHTPKVVAPSVRLPERVSDTSLPIIIAPDPVDGPSASLLKGLQNELIREIGAATTQGVLTPARRADIPKVTESPASAPKPSAALPQAQIAAPQPSGNIRISSSLDPQGSSATTPTDQMRQDLSCIPAQTIAVETWSDGRQMMLQVADLRTRLYNDRDAVDHAAAQQLARIYIHYGFGPEAMRVLQLDPKLQKQNGALIELGEIMEYGFVRTPRVLQNSLECSGPAALWAVLAVRQIDSTIAIDINAVLRSLNSLPLHLRSFLAPELSRRFLEYGDTQSAAAALRSIERVTSEYEPDALMAKASLDLAKGNVERAQASLERVMSSNSAQSAEALIAYVDARLEAGESIEEDVALLVEAYLQELKDSPLAPALQRARVLSLAQSGQFDAAFSALDNQQPELRDNVLEALAATADDIVFLEHVFGAIKADAPHSAPQTRLQLSERLMALGFAAEAERLLSPSAAEFSTPGARRLKARIALAQNKPALSRAHLLGLKTEEDLRLIAQAQQMSGDMAGASDTFAKLRDTEAAGRTALLSENWAAQLDKNAPDYGPLAGIATAAIDPDPAPDGMLSRTRSALAESAETRRTLRALMLDQAAAQN